MSRLLGFTKDRRWLWASGIGLALFLFIQVFPVTGGLFSSNNHPVLPRAAAENKALELAADKFLIKPNQVQEVYVTHLSDSETIGYLSKYDLLQDYDKQWSGEVPADVYRVDLHLRGDAGILELSLQMETGDLVAWRHDSGSAPADALPEQDQADEYASRALSYAAFWGIDAADWEWSGDIDDNGGVKFNSRKAALGEAHVWLKVSVPAEYSSTSSTFPHWAGHSVTYGTEIPQAFTAYMEKQQQRAGWLSIFGFIVPQVIMFILAIVYAGTRGKHTSFLRGIFLASVFFVLYVAITINMIPGFRSQTMDAGADSGDRLNMAFLIIQIVFLAGTAIFTYFCAVAGDGLWKSMGRSLWPRWKEPGYGEAVLKSMKQGYVLAFILLGAQSVILLVLQQTLGAFASSDPTQSTYNMTLPWILPLLAFCAGISEELQSRFFGIGLFRSWFVGLARRILGREPSPRTAIVLTTAAMLPPSILWALGHVGYAIYPFYTRIIELVIMGVLFGWFMLRFGLMAVIFAHIILDAVLMGIQLLFDGLPGDAWAGLFSFVMPALVGIAIWWLYRVIHGRQAQPAQ
ncbi:hypothetical protein SD71_09380 [Cohnella kolymensis]|uniref:CAAX prenyl protease 2/Lysostaphin resistance protein A-like domain-containing protein n=1 Tax=Cohnella kolymensis TaxID=1590652 RepID=A0ABR5A562_9BACL|nr:CPBP family intramembrane glutamic endopeptidase [Cohnella kolymensis]KIL36159.1 hypothetical protein SD71_09380 [Cohnella kolymensis]